MIPLNFVLALSLLIVGNDLFQIAVSFQETTAPHHFLTDVLKDESTTLFILGFVIYGLVKSPEHQLVKWFFLVLLALYDGMGIVGSLWEDGKTVKEVEAAVKAMSFTGYYLHSVLPDLAACGLNLLTAISFQMKKPFFISYPQVEPGQKAVLWSVAGIYYLETLLTLFYAAVMFNGRT